jgi:PAS domain S-box-containing protein
VALSDAREQEVLELRARAQALLDNIPHMAWMKNEDGMFLAVNEAFARATGRSKAGILGKTDRDIWPLELAERYVADDRRVMASGERFYFEEPIAEGGDIKWFETFKTPIRDARGVVTGTVGLARDITERKRAEERQKDLERRMQETQKLESLGVLAGGIAHDFNNLLACMLSNAELLDAALMRAPELEELRQRVLDLRSAALQAAGLTNQMLAYSGRGHFETRSLSVTELVGEMGRLLAASISKKARIDYDLAPELPAIQADAAQMRQVIMNLVTNASEALEDRAGTIRIRTGTEHVDTALEGLHGPASLAPGAYVFLEVSDDGCGMNEEARARLCEPFFTTKFAGRGLGLSAVQGIVRGHGGGIVLRSELRQGTTVKVLLPSADRLPSAAVRRPPEATAEWSGSGLVLLVDDDPRVLSVTALLLRNLGFEVIAASSGREALREFERRANEVRLVVLDVTMPDLAGDQVLVALRKMRPEIPVLLCSGYSEEEVLHRFDQAARTRFLQKPYPFETLKARLMELLSNG